ncbi:hypothetical protein AB0B50_22465 [Streptomyces sp. NPDC041068]|uniref:hypothetical protein n=1 Tax=Streptomyces sp. NPDC041068 TaxID=3155130 RepID=UPI0033DF378E
MVAADTARRPARHDTTATPGHDTAVSPERRRVLLAPVTVSPTKPLTPTHLKYLLSLDLIMRATHAFADIDCAYHHTVYTGSRQVAGFWEYLERRHPGIDAAALGEEDIGHLYVAHHREGAAAPYAAIRPVVRRAEEGWVHPVSDRLLDLWENHYRRLGMADPSLGRGRPELAPADEVIDLLVRHDACLDGRPLAAPVYLDATRKGLPLRLVVNEEGQANYLIHLLRELIPVLPRYDLVVLAHDVELRSDYRTVAHVLETLGAKVARFEVPRVPLDGVTRSARAGGWEGYTLDAFQGPLVERHGLAAFRLGLRLYLVAGLGRTAQQSFTVKHLGRWVRRAERLLAERTDVGADVAPYLTRLTGNLGYADPYRVATALMSRDEEVPVADLLRLVTS